MIRETRAPENEEATEMHPSLPSLGYLSRRRSSGSIRPGLPEVDIGPAFGEELAGARSIRFGIDTEIRQVEEAPAFVDRPGEGREPVRGGASLGAVSQGDALGPPQEGLRVRPPG